MSAYLARPLDPGPPPGIVLLHYTPGRDDRAMGREHALLSIYRKLGNGFTPAVRFALMAAYVKGFRCRPGCDVGLGAIGRRRKAPEERTRGGADERLAPMEI